MALQGAAAHIAACDAPERRAALAGSRPPAPSFAWVASGGGRTEDGGGGLAEQGAVLAKARAWLADARGQAMPLVLLLFLGMLFFVTVVVLAGVQLGDKRQLQAAADAAALAVAGRAKVWEEGLVQWHKYYRDPYPCKDLNGNDTTCYNTWNAPQSPVPVTGEKAELDAQWRQVAGCGATSGGNPQVTVVCDAFQVTRTWRVFTDSSAVLRTLAQQYLQLNSPRSLASGGTPPTVRDLSIAGDGSGQVQLVVTGTVRGFLGPLTLTVTSTAAPPK